MKRFMRSVAGKTIAFILCVMSACLLIMCVGGAVVMVHDGRFYTDSKESLREEIVVDNCLDPYIQNCLMTVIEDRLNYDDGNLYRIIDSDGETVYQSPAAVDTTDWEYALSYYAVRAGEHVIQFNYLRSGTEYYGSGEDYTVHVSVSEGTDAYRSLTIFNHFFEIAWSLRYGIYAIGVASFLLMIATFVMLMSAAGHRPDNDELVMGPLHPVPYDVLLGGCVVIGVGTILVLDDISMFENLFILAGAAVLVGGLSVLLGLCISAACRMKQHDLVKGSLTYFLIKMMGKILRAIGRSIRQGWRFAIDMIRNVLLIWKTVLGLAGLVFLELLVIVLSYHEPFARTVFYLLERILLIPAIIYLAICLRRLQQGGIALANGDLSYQTDTKGMYWDLKKHGENLNSIAEGMSIAVEERMKSERMKTELITNVSHDIKTPLTSIINYATLIGNEPSDNEKISEYAEVLVRQSGKLKRLIEDLVEASKASSGNLEVNLVPCDASVFLQQAAGEYEEKLKEAELELVTKMPDKEIRIMADGRRMWRIFDNLMNNICKYAQPHTRVYLSLEQQDERAVITFKNTSREKLDMSEEELMERFTRGDSSRHTEGNGLGLSIARSMAELQQGSLHLAIDGDLFKAILSFPVIK